jgi:hypothetical protein
VRTTSLLLCNILTFPSATTFVIHLLQTEVLQWNAAISSEVQA